MIIRNGSNNNNSNNWKMVLGVCGVCRTVNKEQGMSWVIMQASIDRQCKPQTPLLTLHPFMSPQNPLLETDHSRTCVAPRRRHASQGPKLNPEPCPEISPELAFLVPLAIVPAPKSLTAHVPSVENPYNSKPQKPNP